MKALKSPLRPKESTELEGIISIWTSLGRLAIYVFLVLVTGHLLFIANHFWVFPSFSWWYFPLGIFMVWLWLIFSKASGGRESRKKMKEDIKQGYVEELQFEFISGVKFPENEDEGDVYILKDNDGQFVYFSGQDLPRRFPKQTVKVRFAPLSRYQLGIASSGKRPEIEKSKTSFYETIFYDKNLHLQTFSILTEEYVSQLKNAGWFRDS